MRRDYSDLKGRVIYEYGSITMFCKSAGINPIHFIAALREGKPLKHETIEKAAKLLGVEEAEVKALFAEKFKGEV